MITVCISAQPPANRTEHTHPGCRLLQGLGDVQTASSLFSHYVGIKIHAAQELCGLPALHTTPPQF